MCNTLMVLLLTFCVFSSGNNTAFAAEKKSKNYSITIEKKPFKLAVKQIEQNTIFLFNYASDDVNENAIVSVKVENGTIEEIVQQLIKGLRLY